MTTTEPVLIVRGFALAALFIWLGGCAEVRETVETASESLNEFVESRGIVPRDPQVLYDEGVALNEQGASTAAVEKFRKAAEAGHGGAAYELGVAYNTGGGVEKDKEQAAVWFNEAVALGEPRAQYLVGAAYYAGLGVEQDYGHAVALLGAAATQGHDRAQYLLATAFANGNGVEKDLAWASRWYGKAARQGHLKAQFAYGVLHATGHGLTRDQRRGLMWLTIAAKGGHARAKELRATLAGRLGAETVAWAEARAAAFEPGPSRAFADPPTVMYVQLRLNRLGFDAGPVDGALGTRTSDGVRSYQQARGQAGDGEVTPDLLVQLLQEPRG